VAGVRFDDRPLARLALLGVLSAVAAALQVIEAPLPHLLPWVKPGLANAIVLFAIVRLSPAFAVGLVLVRSLLSGLALGLLFSPAHLLGVAGGLAAAVVMTLAIGAGRGQLGLAGISVLGAVAHNLAQLGTIGLWAGAGFPLWFHLTIMVWLSIPSGLLVAALAFELFRRTA
jgi:heptaprenyl diphosphate synthase